MRSLSILIVLMSSVLSIAQVCPDGTCPVEMQSPILDPPTDSVLHLCPLDSADVDCITDCGLARQEANATGPLLHVWSATVRIGKGNTCGSGIIVGRDENERALVLTNAHVAGRRRGDQVRCERWSKLGEVERGTGEIIAAGYASGMSVDFALLRCNEGFADDAIPVPIVERQPEDDTPTITCGSPRCEWPSFQLLRWRDTDGQVLYWDPEAIGGRSGSGVVALTESGPRVVGLLTWRANGRGSGQSMPFVLNALRGKLPSAFEKLESGFVPASDQSVIDSIVDDGEEPEPEAKPEKEGDDARLVIRKGRDGSITFDADREVTPIRDAYGMVRWFVRLFVLVLTVVVVAFLVWFVRKMLNTKKKPTPRKGWDP